MNYSNAFITLEELIDTILDDFDTGKKGISYYEYPNVEEQKCIAGLVDTELAYNVATTEDELIFSFAMAGVKKESISIEKSGKVIKITVSKSEPSDKNIVYLYKKIKLPSVTKDIVSSIVLPNKYDCEKLSCTYNDGLLTLKFGLKDEQKPVKVDIQ